MRAYMQISGALFGIIALAHLLRVVRHWPDRSSRIHGALVGFVAWTASRWRPKYLGAAAHARHVSRGLSHSVRLTNRLQKSSWASATMMPAGPRM